MENGIYLVATPIGNTGDITLRALEVLQKADLIACEDTRVSKKLCALLNIATKGKTFIAVHDHNESELAQKVIDEAAAGKIVVYMSDAGSPLISDPGYKLAKAAREQGVYLTTLPGACAAICALQLSGLPSNAFMFCGFIPNKEKARIDFLKKNSQVDATLIFYERADRLVKSLIVMQNIFAQREIAVAREITKLHETCCNGTATELVAYFEQNPNYYNSEGIPWKQNSLHILLLVFPAPVSSSLQDRFLHQNPAPLIWLQLYSYCSPYIPGYSLQRN